MKIVLLTLFSFATFAQSGYFYYTEGRDKGSVVTHTGYLGYTSVCYKGNPWKARRELKNMAMDDIEKANVRVWFDQKNKEIDFYYVNTKCMDDSLDATEGECSAEIIIPKCKK